MAHGLALVSSMSYTTAEEVASHSVGASFTFHAAAFSVAINTWMPWRLMWRARCGEDGNTRWYQCGPIGMYLW